MSKPKSVVSIGIKPSPVTFQAIGENDKLLTVNLVKIGYDKVLLPITNLEYRELCKAKFKQYHLMNHRQGRYSYMEGQDEKDLENNEINFNLQIPPPQLSQVNIFEGDHCHHIIGLVSSWIEIDTSNQFINEFSLQVLLHELNYANFLGLKSVLIAPPKNLNNLSIFNNNINTLLNKFPQLTISISLPICEENSRDPQTGEIVNSVIDSLSTWDMWNSIRLHCNYNNRLTVSLLLPKSNIPQFVINRWLVEPISTILVSTSVFVPNSKDYPVLNKFNQLILWKFIQKNWTHPPVLLLHGVDKLKPGSISKQNDDLELHPMLKLPNLQEDVYLGNLSYHNYLTFISKTNKQNLQITPLELLTTDFFASSSQATTTLQTPLQPLLHDLDNTTYKIFENDLTKYNSYQLAMTKLLSDLITTTTMIEILIVGPGRGPLIDKLLLSLSENNIPNSNYHITLVEKNPNAVIYLQQRNSQHWSNSIDIRHADLRNFQDYCDDDDSPVQYHLVISELLGSFGDNELSPECLYPLQYHKLTAPNCIFIPSRTSSWIAPVFCPTVYNEISHNNMKGASILFQQPYLILLNQFEILSTKFQELWRFQHPDHSGTYPSKKFNKLSFRCKHKGVVHGVIGFFQLVLYKDIVICNNPLLPQPLELTSWLPIFFPLETPVFLSDDQEVEIMMRRGSDGSNNDGTSGGKIWYEWSVESFIYLILPPLKLKQQQQQQIGDGLESTTKKQNEEFMNNNTKNGHGNNHHNSVFGGPGTVERSTPNRDSIMSHSNNNNNNNNNNNTTSEFIEDEEFQVRVRTGVTRIHNLNGSCSSMRL